MLKLIPTRSTIIAMTTIAAMALVAACGSDSSGGSSDGTSAASVGPGTDGSAVEDPRLPPLPDDFEGADVDAARTDLLKFFTPATFTAPGPAFDVKTVTKPVWFVTATSQFPVVPFVNDAFKAAAEVAGVDVNVCPGESTTKDNALCIQQAIDAGAGSLLFFSQDPTTLAAPLKDARDAGLKIVSGNNALKIGDPPDENTDASVSHDYYGAGVINGTYAAARFGGATNGLCLAIPEFKVTGSVCEGFTDAVKKYCPSCDVKTKDIAVAQLVDQTNAVVNAELLSNPDLNFLMGSVDDFCGIAAATVERVRPDGDVVCGGQNGTVDALTSIKDGGFQVVTAGQNTNWWGWAFFDATARAQVGAIGADAVITAPNTLFTSESFDYTGPVDYDSTDAAYGVDATSYEGQFEDLWKP